MTAARSDMDFAAPFPGGAGLTTSPQLLSPPQNSSMQQVSPVQVASFQPIRQMQPALFAQTPVYASDVYRCFKFFLLGS